MPSNVLNSWAKKYKISKKRLERWWKEAKQSADKEKMPKSRYYQYAMGIMKRRLGYALRSEDYILSTDEKLAILAMETDTNTESREEKLVALVFGK